MKFGAILPHTKLYGGVKRFFELGEALYRYGHELNVFTPTGEAPEWYTGTVMTRSFDELQSSTLDAAFITETQYLEILQNSGVRKKIFYFVRPSDSLSVLRKYPEVEVFANSTDTYRRARRRYGVESFPAYGGIDTTTFTPKQIVPKHNNEPIVIIAYGRLVEKKKGTAIVVAACEKVYHRGYNIKLILFDTPVNEKAVAAIKNFRTTVPFEYVVNHPIDKNTELFHRGDIFVMAEKKAGHSNTTAEAMACGLPVIGTRSGASDFLIDNVTGLVVPRWSFSIAKAIIRLINDFDLRKKLAGNGRSKIEEFNWDHLAVAIIKHIETV